MVADSCGQCYNNDMKYVSGKTGGTWKCTEKCKALTQFEVDTVHEFKSYFEKSLRDVMSLLSMCDEDCPYTHHSKFVILMRVKFIMEACRMPLDSIFSTVVEGTQEGAAQECELRKPDLELRLQAENNIAIAEYRKAVEDYPKNVCWLSSCTKEKMSQWSSLTTTWEQFAETIYVAEKS